MQAAPRESGGGIALALLNDFYWIELGIRSYLRSRGNPEFSRADGMVIANITLGYNRPSDIARQLGVSRQAIHRQIRQMKEKGIVELNDDPTDGRIKLVVITDLARKMNEDGIVAMGILWEELGRRLGKANLNRAAKVLARDWGPPVFFD
jgi:DNA-binding MarR family transcriptional regulator